MARPANRTRAQWYRWLWSIGGVPTAGGQNIVDRPDRYGWDGRRGRLAETFSQPLQARRRAGRDNLRTGSPTSVNVPRTSSSLRRPKSRSFRQRSAPSDSPASQGPRRRPDRLRDDERSRPPPAWPPHDHRVCAPALSRPRPDGALALRFYSLAPFSSRPNRTTSPRGVRVITSYANLRSPAPA
jgi:hypothetical protein